MLHLVQLSQFKRDVKRCIKRNKDMSKLRELISMLIENKPIPKKYNDHPLRNNWNHHRDIHLEPDWLLIYKVDGNTLYLVRTGTHADIF